MARGFVAVLPLRQFGGGSGTVRVEDDEAVATTLSAGLRKNTKEIWLGGSYWESLWLIGVKMMIGCEYWMICRVLIEVDD